MASIINDIGGLKRIQFARPHDRQRVAIRLGRVSMKQARAVCGNIESLIACANSGTSMSDDVATWVANIGTKLYNALADHGLLTARRRVQLGDFLAGYRTRRTDVKDGTSTNYRTATNRLLAHFKPTTCLHEITPGDADAWLVYLWEQEYAPATIGKTVKVARQFFRDAIRSGIIATNPFSDLKAPAQTNRKRLAFVGRDEIAKVIDATPCVEWKLIIALARFGGIRTPSEQFVLTWDDINWGENRFRVDSPKTGERWVPIFPELLPYLSAAWDAAADGTVFVIAKHRDDKNLGTHLRRLIRRAGISAWPRIFHNLRASRQTELENTFPGHVVCAWLGNSESVARKHYLQVTDEHFRTAAQSSQKAAQIFEESNGISGNDARPEMQKTTVSIGKTVVSEVGRVTPTGFQPVAGTAISDNDLHQNSKTDGAKSGANFDADELLAETVRAFMDGDVE